MTDNTTRVIKLANGESIVCTCIPTRTDEGSNKLHVIHPLKMELKIESLRKVLLRHYLYLVGYNHLQNQMNLILRNQQS